MPGPNEALGIGNDTAQLLGGGAFAAGAREYLRPTAGWKRRLAGSILVLLGAWLFGPFVARLVHDVSGSQIPLTVAGSVAGLACLGISEGIMTAADRLEMSALSWFTRQPAAVPAAGAPATPPVIAPAPPVPSPAPPEHHP